MVSQPRFPAVHMKAATGDAALVHLLREGLSQALASDCIDLVLALALSRGCLDRVPSGGERLRRFLVGPLTDSMEGFVGTMVAATTVDALQDMLAPMIANETGESRSESGVRIRGEVSPARTMEFPEPDTVRFQVPDRVERSDEPTLRFSTTQKLTVVLVTQDSGASRKLQAQLDGSFTIVTATEIFHLMDAIKSASRQRALLVLDCRRPAIAPSMMMNVVSRIPEDTQVVLWGNAHQIEQQVSALGRCAASWMRCDEEALAEDIAALIASALARCA